MINKNTSGSQWRKWDLHIHTPQTAKNDQFSSLDDVWEEYVSKLEKQTDIFAFGITDYFSMNNYLKVKKYQDEDGRLAGKFLIPNIELRLLPVTGESTPINIHVIFDPSLKYDDIEREFFRNLKFTYSGNEYACVRADLIALGKAYKNEKSLDDVTAYKEGIGQFNIAFDKLRDLLLNNFFAGHCLVGVANSHKDGNSGIQESALTATRREIYRMSDFVFSGTPKDMEYFLGKGKDTVNILIENYGGIKPCLTGSDAHSFDSIGVFPENRFTWIKADTTFDGLKQIIYEPEERVRVQELIPEEKPEYQVIESISFNDETFGKQIISLNQNLNTIIGGRSSGKSILLGCIAKLAGFLGEIKKDNEKYNAYISTLTGKAKLVWKDKNEDSKRHIEYYGQDHIHTLTGDTNEVNQIVENIVKKYEDKKNSLDTYSNFVTGNKTAITNKLNDWYLQKTKIQDLSEQCEKLGSEKGIKSQIEKLKEELDQIKKQLPESLTAEELKDFEELQNTLQVNEVNKKQLDADISYLSSLKALEFLNSIDTSIVSLSTETKKAVIEFYNKLREETRQKFTDFVENKMREISAMIEKANAQAEEIKSNDIYKRGLQFISDNKAYSEKEEQLKTETNKLGEIQKLKSEQKSLLESKSTNQKEILSLHFQYYTKLADILSSITTEKDGVDITAKISHSEENIQEQFTSFFNKNSGEGKTYKDFHYTDFEEYKQTVTTIFQQIDTGEIKILKENNIQQALISIFSSNYFSIDYKVKYDGDNLDDMSEGKKAFVVLRLLLDFTDEKCPILIDQPEDDLDNRAIYDQLVTYLRSKKKQRQIILVTHNPNIVVWADAELVIVANQDGVKNRNQDNVKFEYFGGSLEMTEEDTSATTILLSKGIREHVCDILEGGDEAFQKREKKYGYK